MAMFRADPFRRDIKWRAVYENKIHGVRRILNEPMVLRMESDGGRQIEFSRGNLPQHLGTISDGVLPRIHNDWL